MTQYNINRTYDTIYIYKNKITKIGNQWELEQLDYIGIQMFIFLYIYCVDDGVRVFAGGSLRPRIQEQALPRADCRHQTRVPPLGGHQDQNKARHGPHPRLLQQR